MQSPVIPTSPGPGTLSFIMLDPLIIFAAICAIIYFLHYYKKPHMGFDLSKMSVKPPTITAVMLVIALLGPVSFNIYLEGWSGSIIYLTGMAWQIIGLNLYEVMFGVAFLLVELPFTFLRLVFVYQIYRYFCGKATMRNTILIGVLAEIQFPLIGLMVMSVAIWSPSIAAVFTVPVPLLLIVGLTFLRYVPVPRPIDGWKELDKGPDWWKQTPQSTPESQ